MGFNDDRIEALRLRTGQLTRSWLIDPAWLDPDLVERALTEVRDALGAAATHALRWRLFPDGCGGFLIVFALGRRLLRERERSPQYAATVRAGEACERYHPAVRITSFEAVGDSEPFAVVGIDARWPPTWLCWQTTCEIVDHLVELIAEEAADH